MGLFGRRRGNRMRVLQAAGTRLDLTSRDAVRQLATTRTAQAWQQDAWGYRDMIGELRFAGQFKARAVARVRYFPAQIIPDQDEPIPFDAEEGITVSPALQRACEEELARLPLDAGYRFLGIIDENLSFTGECFLHGHTDESGEEVWDALSVSEVILNQDGTASIRRHGQGMARPVDADNEELLRLWVPHPRWGNLADSPMRALQDVCEDIILSGREIRAASRSRIAANGILKIPRGLALLSNTREDTVMADDAAFMSELTAALVAPISNEGHPGAVAPAALIGEIEDLAAFDHIRIDRETSADLINKVEQGLARLGRGLDIPPEIITGMGAANHWSAWQIDSSTYRYHIDPSVRTIADALTEAFLRPALLARREGFTAAEVKQVMLWRDAGVLTENPNRGQDAKDAFDRGSIGFKALNDALGFSPADAPDDEELIKMIAVKIGVDPATSALLLQSALGIRTPITVQAQPPEQPRQVDPAPPAPGATPPDDGTPNTPPAGITAGGRALADFLLAAAEPDLSGWTVAGDGGRRLMEIDRALRDRLLVAADAALTRALEKAGSRVRSKAQRDAATRARLANVAVDRMAAHLGRDAVLALGITEQELLSGMLDDLEGKFARWTEAAIVEAIRVVLGMLGIRPGSRQARDTEERLTTSMTARMPFAWARMRDRLFALAERLLFRPDEEPDVRGEAHDLKVPSSIARDAVSDVGGELPETDAGTPDRSGGIGGGADIADTMRDNGAAELGFEWVYGITPIRKFEPHVDLDGGRFTGFTDPALSTVGTRHQWVGPYFAPGDHDGCMCDFMPVWAIPDYTALETEVTGPESASMRDTRTLAEEDDRAGRRNTTAQLTRDERDRILRLRDRWIKGD